MTAARRPTRRPRHSREALTHDEAVALEEQLGRPICWPPVHHHGSPEGLLAQKLTDDGANQVPPKGTQ